MPNRLADETSPYLLQHADNPVDWRPWGDEAFAEARRRDVPVFVSVGYSSCHWCHVMAHESFEDEDVAALMNARFINVKVDREERPDVDAVYMAATQALTGRGGWPMSVFVTPDGRPFYAGTYWPREAHHGLPSFPQVLGAVADAWADRRDEVVASAASISGALRRHRDAEPAEAFDPSVSDRVATVLVERAWDRRHGGFGGAPKFPQAMTIEYLLDHHARTGEPAPLEAATHSLDAMARGGIRDQIGGGFHRYATDGIWLVPHFEKMLYDNALLVSAYARAATLTGRDGLADVARGIADELLREMRTEDGAFISATDADSEGVEGRYFVWSSDEFAAVVAAAGGDPDLWADVYDVTPGGNWEGVNILRTLRPPFEVAAAHDVDPATFADEAGRVRDALRRARAERVPPGRDDKVLTSWNALAIRGLARAGAHLDEPRYVDAAVAALDAVERLLVVDGTLLHTWRDGVASVPAFLEDVAGLAAANLQVYEITGDVRRFERAATLARQAHERFEDPEGGYFQTAHDAEELYLRPKETWDNATPSGNSLAAGVFARLGALTGDHVWRDRAAAVVRLFQDAAARMPTGYGELMQTVEFLAADQREVAVVGAPAGRAPLERVIWRRPRPGLVVAPSDGPADRPPVLAARTPVDGRAAAYVCRSFACERPVTEPADLAALLDPPDRA